MDLTPKQLFERHLPFIQKVVAYAVRRYHLDPEETKDFSQDVMVKMLSRDCEVFSDFRGESKMESYLTVVVERCLQDYINKLWGKWRPSAAAKRLGPLAEQLERLVYRDGHSLDMAIEMLKQRGAKESKEEIKKLFGELSSRPIRVFEGEGPLQNVPSSTKTDQPIREQEHEANVQKAEQALQRALETLPADDRLLVRMKSEGTTIQEIAKLLRADAKKLYRRYEKSLKIMRELLLKDGIRPEDLFET